MGRAGKDGKYVALWLSRTSREHSCEVIYFYSTLLSYKRLPNSCRCGPFHIHFHNALTQYGTATKFRRHMQESFHLQVALQKDDELYCTCAFPAITCQNVCFEKGLLNACFKFVYESSAFLIAHVFCCLKICFVFSHQDQLSADMYSFMAKEIDYASYFQTVSTTSLQTVALSEETEIFCLSITSLSGLFLSFCPADRSPGRVPQEVIRAASKCSSPDQSSSG